MIVSAIPIRVEEHVLGLGFRTARDEDEHNGNGNCHRRRRGEESGTYSAGPQHAIVSFAGQFRGNRSYVTTLPRSDEISYPSFPPPGSAARSSETRHASPMDGARTPRAITPASSAYSR